MSGYDFHPEALIDLEEISEYISEDNAVAAAGFIDAVEASLEALVSFPLRGHKRPDLTTRPLRFILVREYLIA